MVAQFVWLPGVGGPAPQIWHTEAVGVDHSTGKPRKPLPLASYTLTEHDYGLSIKELAKRYPCPPDAELKALRNFWEQSTLNMLCDLFEEIIGPGTMAREDAIATIAQTCDVELKEVEALASGDIEGVGLRTAVRIALACNRHLAFRQFDHDDER